ncbi:S9 family peptidase [Alicyclobacillus dauci]|uniref:S9 family peptidase n=1 Tax=Alicyclobacillus dauci TaxID=1475485 RepID=A0ABY6YYZ3_9BACL|nr:S9 family peptidase [Alicyclobacillus dauci]WAH35807.1 S9 family peptidase [Alicyclobacillus dauci]
MKKWTIEEVVSFGRPSGVTISPDGNRVVYSLQTTDDEASEYVHKLWSVDEHDRLHPVQLTQGDSKDTYPQMSPDGKWLGFISDRRPKSEDDDTEYPDHQLYVLPLAGGEARLVSDELGEVYDFTFTGDGKRLFVITDAKETPYEKYMRTSAEEDKRDVIHEERIVRPKRICSIALPTFEVTTIYPRDYGLQQLAVNHDGSLVVFVTNYTGLVNDVDRCDIWALARSDSGAFHARPLVTRKGACVQPVISPDGTRIAFIAPRGDLSEHAQSDLWLIHLNGKSVENVTEALGFVGDVEDIAWNGPHEIIAATERGLYAPIVGFTCSENVEEWSFRYITLETAIVQEFAVADKAKRIAYIAETKDDPADVFVSSLDEQIGKAWTNLHADKRDLPRARVEAFTWNSFDGWQMEGVLVLPNEELVGAGPYPLIVDIHGGPAWHTTLSFAHYLNYHWLASLGYAVFSPNYRGGIGYGQTYIQANHRDLGGGDYRDIMAGVDAVLETGRINPERLGLTGGSYGGYMTNWIIGHDHRFKAAVSEFGIWSLFTDFGCSTQRTWEIMYLGTYWENEELYLERSPSRYVQNIQTPVLIIHGDADDNTFPANSREMYNALVEAGKTVEYIHYPREGHGIHEPRHRMDELVRIAEWFQHYLPTSQTLPVVPLKQAQRIEPTHLSVSVNNVRETTDYAPYGTDYERIIEVRLTMERTGSGENAAVQVHLGDAATSDFVLVRTSAEAHQRPSVFPSDHLTPLAVCLGDSGSIVTGELVVHLLNETSVCVLFPSGALEYAKLSDFHLRIKDVRFQLVE